MSYDFGVLSVIRRELAQAKRHFENVHTLAKVNFKPSVKLQYKINGRDYFGRVIEVIGMPGRTQIRVENLSTLKTRDIRLEDVTGIVQE